LLPGNVISRGRGRQRVQPPENAEPNDRHTGEAQDDFARHPGGGQVFGFKAREGVKNPDHNPTATEQPHGQKAEVSSASGMTPMAFRMLPSVGPVTDNCDWPGDQLH